MHIILASGVEALASLSMDQIQLSNGKKLNVTLKEPDWAFSYIKRLETLFEEVQKNSPTISLQNWAVVNNINLDGKSYLKIIYLKLRINCSFKNEINRSV